MKIDKHVKKVPDNSDILKIVADNKDEIAKILGIVILKGELEKLKEENKMLKSFFEMLKSFFSNFFKADDNGEVKKENKEFKSKNKDLEKNLTVLSEKFKSKNEEFENSLTVLREKNDSLKSDSNDSKAKLQELLRKNDLSPPTRLKKIYDSLDKTTKSNLDNIFKSEDELSLFASGILNIRAVWDYAAYLIKEHKDSEFEKVKDIFYLLFDFQTVNSLSLQQVNEGDKFDMDYFSRDNRSEKQSGKVAEVVLKGFLENGKIVKKSIVKVK